MVSDLLRREFLGLVGSVGLVGIAGCSDTTDADERQNNELTVSPTDTPTETPTETPTATPVPCQERRPDLYEHDLHVENDLGDAVRITVNITPESGGDPVYSERFTVNPGRREFVMELDIEPGLYVIEAHRVDGDSSDSLTYDIDDLQNRFVDVRVDDYDGVSMNVGVGTVIFEGTESNPC